MNRAHALFALIVGLALVCAGQGVAVAQQDSVATLIERLSGENASVREAAASALADSGVDAVGPLFALLDSVEGDPTALARNAVEALVRGINDPVEASAAADALLREARSRTRPEVVQEAMRLLALVANGEQVDAIAPMLGDPGVFDMAIYVLACTPGPEATEALVAALAHADSPERAVAFLGALGERGDEAAAEAVARSASSEDESVRRAALTALGRIASPVSEECLGASFDGPNAVTARAAYLALADLMLATGRRMSAARMFEEYAGLAVTEQDRCAALRGLAKTGGATVDDLAEALRSGGRDLRGVAREELARSEDPSATEAAIGIVADGSDEAKVAALWVLGKRGGEDAVGVALRAVRDGDEAVRLAGYNALAELAAPRSAHDLMRYVLREEPGEAREAGIRAMVRIDGEEAVDAISGAVAGSVEIPDETRIALLRSLGARHGSRAAPIIIHATGSDSEPVRIAAFEALGDLADATAIPSLLAHVAPGNRESDLPRLVAAIARVPREAAMPELQAALRSSSLDGPAVALAVLGSYRDASLRPLFLEWASDQWDVRAAAAIEALAGIAEPGDLALFRQYAGDARAEVAAAGVRGLLTLAESREPQDVQALALYVESLPIAREDAEKRRALGGIARIGDPSALEVVRPLLDAPGGVANELAAAIAPIADQRKDTNREEAIELYSKALTLTSDRDLLVRTARALRDLGVETDLAASGGFITGWWVAGPFKTREALRGMDLVDPAAIDLSKPVTGEGQESAWTHHRVDDPLGLIDLETAVARMDNVGCYLYAEVESDADREVTLKAGSDDDLILWLNGEQVIRSLTDRGWTLDQDVVSVKLRKGTNTILCKVLQGGGQWSCSVRLVGEDGNPLVLPQRRP